MTDDGTGLEMTVASRDSSSEDDDEIESDDDDNVEKNAKPRAVREDDDSDEGV